MKRFFLTVSVLTLILAGFGCQRDGQDMQKQEEMDQDYIHRSAPSNVQYRKPTTEAEAMSAEL